MEELDDFINYRDDFLVKFREFVGVSKFDYSEVVTDRRLKFHRNGMNKKKTEVFIIRAHPVDDTIKVYNEKTKKRYWIRLSKGIEFI
tara:strand:+ start:413 stop:673 length:261 start_codon:yes stop_codon:yes gene_type:complete